MNTQTNNRLLISSEMAEKLRKLISHEEMAEKIRKIEKVGK